MKPRAHYEDVENARILAFDRLVGIERAEKIFIVIPTADSHHRGVDVLQVRKNVACFPKLIVVRVRHHLIPKLDARAELLRVNVAGITQASHRQVQVVTVLRWRSERFKISADRSR